VADGSVDFYAALLDDDAEALYEQAPCGYLSTTPDGTIVKVNQTFLTWTGYLRQDLVGRRTFAELLTGGGRIYHETHYAPMLAMHGIARGIALDLVRADGARLPSLVSSIVQRDDQGAPVVVRTAVFDATERRQYEQELLAAKQRAEEAARQATLLARTLQQTLIPPAPPDIPGLDVAAAYRPAGTGAQVGGDFYDVFELGSDDWLVVIGDVMGKGVDAAVVTAEARHTIRAAAVRHSRPSDVLQTLNRVLLLHQSDRFCTVALLRLRRRDDIWLATVSVGGHPLPLLTHRGSPPTLFGRPGSLIGVLPTDDFQDQQVRLGPGQAIVLYTDGVTEGRRDGEFFGDARLLATVAAVAADAPSAGVLIEGILAQALQFQSGDPRDDITVVAVRVP
jgi:sigma-B regulation protein RsbU (phosphoserine phosphatase)